MFKSKQRPIGITQAEHQKLAGTLALLWGNADFERPPISSATFLKGIGLHDRAYSNFDTLPIGEIPEQEWIELTRAGFAMAWADHSADLIAKIYLQRLMSYASTPARQAQAAAMAREIQEYAQRYSLDLATFTRIDRITNLCDRIAFDFCFEAPAAGSVRIFPRNQSDDEVAVHYHTLNGNISLDPWPLCVESYKGYLVGYQLAGYPQVLEPVIVEYSIIPGR